MPWNGSWLLRIMSMSPPRFLCTMHAIFLCRNIFLRQQAESRKIGRFETCPTTISGVFQSKYNTGISHFIFLYDGVKNSTHLWIIKNLNDTIFQVLQ